MQRRVRENSVEAPFLFGLLQVVPIAFDPCNRCRGIVGERRGRRIGTGFGEQIGGGVESDDAAVRLHRGQQRR